MNPQQGIWLQQARSDFEVFELLRKLGLPDCHLLHYLQMTTEKLGKAWLWRNGTAPKASHQAFRKFVIGLGQVAGKQAIEVFKCSHKKQFRAMVRNITPIAHAVENLAPQLAGDGPNPEYPWPTEGPICAPVQFEFPIWNEITGTAKGRDLMRFIERAIRWFETIC